MMPDWMTAWIRKNTKIVSALTSSDTKMPVLLPPSIWISPVVGFVVMVVVLLLMKMAPMMRR